MHYGFNICYWLFNHTKLAMPWIRFRLAFWSITSKRYVISPYTRKQLVINELPFTLIVSDIAEPCSLSHMGCEKYIGRFIDISRSGSIVKYISGWLQCVAIKRDLTQVTFKREKHQVPTLYRLHLVLTIQWIKTWRSNFYSFYIYTYRIPCDTRTVRWLGTEHVRQIVTCAKEGESTCWYHLVLFALWRLRETCLYIRAKLKLDSFDERALFCSFRNNRFWISASKVKA
jgi:hypothetical protein